jgi:hypothetical protein
MAFNVLSVSELIAVLTLYCILFCPLFCWVLCGRSFLSQFATLLVQGTRPWLD